MNAETPTPTKCSPKSRMKVHLHRLQLDGQTYRVVTLRPSSPARFSTNYYHNTWHILSDVGGSQLLGRLLWGLSYQTKPGTIVLLHGQHIQPCPFEADPSLPIVLMNSHLASLNTQKLRLLKKRLPHLTKPTQTIRWHTFGLEQLHDIETIWEMWDQARRKYSTSQRDFGGHETMARQGGFICYRAAPEILRCQAKNVFSMTPWHSSRDTYGEEYRFLADGDGEVQIFSNYRKQVSAAKQARQQVHPSPEQLAHQKEREQHRVIRRRDKIMAGERKRRPSKRGKDLSPSTPTAN